MNNQTKVINTLSDAPISFDETHNHDHMLQFNYVETLRMMFRARMEDFVKTEDFTHFVASRQIKKQIDAILGRK